jgi:hypothetical protein
VICAGRVIRLHELLARPGVQPVSVGTGCRLLGGSVHGAPSAARVSINTPMGIHMAATGEGPDTFLRSGIGDQSPWGG